MSKVKFDAVLFDLDGTLADTAPDLIGALNKLLSEKGKPKKSIKELRTAVSRGAAGLIPLGFDVIPTHPEFFELKTRFLKYYADAICEKTKLFDGMQLVLEHLVKDNIPWGIVTNKNRELTTKLLGKLNLPKPNCVVCGDDVVRAKPWPDTLLLAAKKIGVEPSQCVYVGDYFNDGEAAQAAGMTAIAATYGYAEPSPPIHSWNVAYWIDKPQDLYDILWEK